MILFLRCSASRVPWMIILCVQKLAVEDCTNLPGSIILTDMPKTLVFDRGSGSDMSRALVFTMDSKAVKMCQMIKDAARLCWDLQYSLKMVILKEEMQEVLCFLSRTCRVFVRGDLIFPL